MTAPRPLGCPFCGGKGLIAQPWMSVTCDQCGARSAMHETTEDAVAAWNARVNDQGVLR
jgi:hypothetical protein